MEKKEKGKWKMEKKERERRGKLSKSLRVSR